MSTKGKATKGYAEKETQVGFVKRRKNQRQRERELKKGGVNTWSLASDGVEDNLLGEPLAGTRKGLS